jgi:hypothetical protein
MELSKRIDNILGPWPTPDQVREALLLLARHLQRHDERERAEAQNQSGKGAS